MKYDYTDISDSGSNKWFTTIRSSFIFFAKNISNFIINFNNYPVTFDDNNSGFTWYTNTPKKDGKLFFNIHYTRDNKMGDFIINHIPNISGDNIVIIKN